MDEQEQLIRNIARELQLASHQAKDREVSDLFADLQKRMKGQLDSLRTDLNSRLTETERKMEQTIAQALKDVRSDMELKHKDYDHAIDTHKTRLSMVERIVFGAVTIALIAIVTALLAKVIV